MKHWGVAAVVLVALLFLALVVGGGDKPRRAATAAPASTTPAAVAPPPDTHVVQRVVDGDTLVIDTGERVRLLGIDACEASTPAGPVATDVLRNYTDDGPVVLVADGTRDHDDYGRLLRRVTTPSGVDLGELMVAGSSVGVYQGRNDATPAYVAELKAADYDGRDCSIANNNGITTTTPTTSAQSGDVEVDVDHDDNHKSRFCRRHIWC